MKKLLYSIIVLAFGITVFYLFSQPQNGDIAGDVTIILIDENETVLSTNVLSFTSEMSLYDLISQEYQIKCAGSNYQVSDSCDTVLFNSHVILTIDELDTDWTNSFIRIYVNDVPSQYGIDLIMLKDQNIYKFVYTEVGE